MTKNKLQIDGASNQTLHGQEATWDGEPNSILSIDSSFTLTYSRDMIL